MLITADIDGENMADFDIVPDTNLFPTLGNTGYRFHEALAEFIDNSLDAALDNKVTVRIFLTQDFLEVADDASGIDENKFRDALRLAHIDKRNKRLGEFGLGLKTAAVTLGKKFSITTTTKGMDKWLVYNFDEAEWKKQGDWTAKVLTPTKENKEEHGTTIKVRDFKFKYYPNLVTNTKRHLAKRYSNFIKSNILQLQFNTTIIAPIEPELRTIGDVKKNNINFKIDESRSITGWYGFLEKRSIGGDYGFNLIKNNRVIVENSKFGFKPHPEVAMLAGELHLDFVPVTHNKRDFLTTSFEYEKAIEKFTDFLNREKIIITARALSRGEKKNKQVEKLKRQLSEISKNLDYIVEPGQETLKSYNIDGTNPGASQTKRIVEEEKFNLKIFGKAYTIKFGLDSLGNENKIGEYMSPKEGEIEVIINTDFPYYSIVKDYSSYSTFLIIEFLADYILKNNKMEYDLITLRNEILRTVGRGKLEHDRRMKKKERIMKLEHELKMLKELGT